MCNLLPLLPLLAIVSSAFAQTKPADDPPPSPATSARETALDNLLSERDSEASLKSRIETARKNGISEQAILEAQFLFHVDRREDDAIAAMLPEFLKRKDDFKLADSSIFSVKEDWLAVVEYVQAIAALKKNDKDGFKSHILEAFWLSPRQASAFAPQIDRLRLEEAMRNVRVDFESRYLPLGGGDAVVLKNLIAGRKAMILHFWSPSSRECKESLPDYVATANALGALGIAMVSISPDDAAKSVAEGTTLLAGLGDKPPGAWLLDAKTSSLAERLRVQGLPLFVVVSPEGKILFNGDPSDDELWDTLRKIDPRIDRPKAPDAVDER